MNHVILGKTVEDLRKHKGIKLFSIRTKWTYYKVFHIKFIGNRDEKTGTYE